MNTSVRNGMGYIMGFLLFVVGMPTIMWVASGCEAPQRLLLRQYVGSALLAIVGLTLSIWSIVHMRQYGKGNPMDAFNHEIGERTKHLMTKGPYKWSRNPMLSGTYIYLLSIVLLLHTWQALVAYIVFIGIMSIQVHYEQKRLQADFGAEYELYCQTTPLFLPVLGLGAVVGLSLLSM